MSSCSETYLVASEVGLLVERNLSHTCDRASRGTSLDGEGAAVAIYQFGAKLTDEK